MPQRKENVPSVLKLLSSEVNLEILSILRSGSFNPRELAKILGRDETDVSRRLKALEKAGLVEGRWVRIGNRNVRKYSLRVDELRVNFEPEGIRVEAEREEDYSTRIVKDEAPVVEEFFGRRRELNLLSSVKEPVVVIYGMAGIGKTTLAAKAFPDALWYPVREGDSFEYFTWQLGLHLNRLGYRGLIEYLRTGNTEERELFEIALEGIDETGAVIVIDDFHRCRDERLGRFITFLAERMKRGKAVILSRERPKFGILGSFYLKLDGLDVESSYRLLKTKRGNVDVRDFAEIYRLTRGHPLALTLFSQAYPGRVETAAENFFEFLLEEVYSRLSDKEKFLLQVISLFEEPLEYGALKKLYGEKSLFPVLHSLLRKGLVERRGGVYFLHDLIRSFVERVGEVEGGEYYRKYVEYLMEKGEETAFISAFRYALMLGDEELIKRLVELRLRRFKGLVRSFKGPYLKVLSAGKGNPYVDLELGHLYFQNGFFEKALDIWLRVEGKVDGVFKADVLTSIADAYLEMNRLEEAEEYLKKSQEIAKASEDPEVKLWYYMTLTKFHYYKNEPEKAMESAFMELKILREIGGNPELEALVLLHIGDINSWMGKPKEALKYYSEAVDVARLHGIPFFENLAHMELAKVYYHLGDYEKAVEHSSKAAEYFKRMRNYRRAVDTLAYRCVSFIGSGELEKAEEDAGEMIRMGQGSNYPLAWAGYIFLAAVKNLKGEPWEEYLILGREKLRDNRHLYEAVLEELNQVFDVSAFGESSPRKIEEF
ncbi:ArsR family transcriptional regulator [Thermococcus profundus]|uniref:ArsR family transcriptional regulator n=1 Tax=Thermococcus profundus TaxID=49899 RepID=A0A2Z2ML42_THEPR|nr:tetratricopeptide repeat protein [Thermococcus profundus]ASJ02678.1 ArsR family transcriptional regulator [Thermococcus profundus]